MEIIAKNLDKRRRYYLVLDCETATLLAAKKYKSEEERKRVAIAKPLIYDIGWTIIDRQGRIYEQRNFLISEIFSNPMVFDTAYYKEKRPLYLRKLREGDINLVTWREASAALEEAMSKVYAVGAYNAMFDFKKAIPFTELYVNEIYNEDFAEWYAMQEQICDSIAAKKAPENTHDFDPEHFLFHGKQHNLFDLWGLSCKYLLNNDAYKRACIENEWQTESGKYFKTSAETAFRFISANIDFEEAHTAIDDAIIESELFRRIARPRAANIEIGIEYFPFRLLGMVDKWVFENM